jgi:hypothetical protein
MQNGSQPQINRWKKLSVSVVGVKRKLIAVGLPVTRQPRTDPGVRFSRTGLFVNTRFRSKTKVMAWPVARFVVVRVRAGISSVLNGPGIAVPLTALIKPPLMDPSHVIEELVQAVEVAKPVALITLRLVRYPQQ